MNKKQTLFSIFLSVYKQNKKAHTDIEKHTQRQTQIIKTLVHTHLEMHTPQHTYQVINCQTAQPEFSKGQD